MSVESYLGLSFVVNFQNFDYAVSKLLDPANLIADACGIAENCRVLKTDYFAIQFDFSVWLGSIFGNSQDDILIKLRSICEFKKSLSHQTLASRLIIIIQISLTITEGLSDEEHAFNLEIKFESNADTSLYVLEEQLRYILLLICCRHTLRKFPSKNMQTVG